MVEKCQKHVYVICENSLGSIDFVTNIKAVMDYLETFFIKMFSYLILLDEIQGKQQQSVKSSELNTFLRFENLQLKNKVRKIT